MEHRSATTPTAPRSDEAPIDRLYTKFYCGNDPAKSWPGEYIVRIFLGNYPRLRLDGEYAGKSLLDMGMGDGRNLRFLAGLGFEAHGVEVTDSICRQVKESFDGAGLPANFRAGKNGDIPYGDERFHYLVSWNSSHYLGENAGAERYGEHVEEFARVLKQGGRLVLAAPMNSNFTFEGSEAAGPGARRIVSDPYGIRDGQVFRCFSAAGDFLAEFEGLFKNLSYAALVDDCFGQKNHYHIVVGEKR